MIREIDPYEFPQYHEELSKAARNILPYLAFSSSETEQFVKSTEWHKKKTNMAYRFENPAGQKVFIGGRGRLEYIIPSNWDNRYTLIEEALQHLITKICDNDPDAEIHFTINEIVPSHSAYFMALLPKLGFDLHPRIEMKADQNIIHDLQLPTLPHGFEELPYKEKHMDMFANAYKSFAEAADGQGNIHSPEERQKRSEKLEPFQEYYCYAESSQELREKTWLGVTYQSQIIGYCFSDIWDSGKRMIVLELAVDPEFWGQKLGRYLTIRNLQKTKQHYSTPQSYFTIGTQRDNVRARTLYHHLGFERWQVSTRIAYPGKKTD